MSEHPPERTSGLSSMTAMAPSPEDAAERLRQLWLNGQRPDVDAFLAAAGPLAVPQVAAVLRVDQRYRLTMGERVPVEDYLRRHPAVASDPEAAIDLVYGEFLLCERLGERPDVAEYLGRFPEYADTLRAQMNLHRAVAGSSDGSLTLSTPPDADVLRPGIPGYEILGELGRGAMGVVYRARHLRLGRVVALKMVLHAEHARQDDLRRFLSEAEAVAQLQHPHIVQLFDSGQHDGVPYFTLELIEGGTLADRLRQNPLTPRDAAHLTEQTALGVQHAHERGIVHRDLKPGNVLLTREGTPRVADFGLAKRVDVGTALTATGAVMGTPSYMAPEQAGGGSKRVGPPADVYALGALLYECVSGRPPFRAATALDTLLQVLKDDPLPLRTLAPTCPRDLETICHKCLHKEPARRYASARELADDLRRFQSGEPIQARPVGWVERAVKWSRRRPAVAALIAVGLLLAFSAVFGWFGYDHQLRRSRAEGRKDSLLAALLRMDTPAVGHVVDELAVFHAVVAPELRAILDDPRSTPREKLHASLTLLRGDTGQVEYLYSRLLTAEPQDAVVIRDALRPHAPTLSRRLWAVLENANGDPDPRLRAACALAAYEPDDPRWAKVSRDVAERLAVENVLVLGRWAIALKPAGKHLLPPLAPMLLEEERGAAERRALMQLYSDYAGEVADAFGPLEKVLSEPAVAVGEARLAQVRRQANAAVALAALERWEKVSPLLRHAPDPTLRSYLIDRLAPGGVEARGVMGRLHGEADVSARRALLLALGELGRDRLPPYTRQGMVPALVTLYQDDPDPGIHGAAGWLLGRWQQQGAVAEVDQTNRGRPPAGARRWYVNGQGQTMVLVPPGEFLKGEGPRQQKVRVERGFALAAREVTVAEFCRFRKDHQVARQYAPTDDCPVNRTTWYDAAAYCNWLSKEEGIAEEQWCYAPNEKGQYAEGMKVKANAMTLSGYRLPSVAEWELACRAGSVTGYFMGDSEDLLSKYSWYLANSSGRSHPAGQLRPNDLGLFDMYGNVWEWCQEKIDSRGIEGSDKGVDDVVKNNSGRTARGGMFLHAADAVRTAFRLANVPAEPGVYHGFRPARTYP